MLLRLFWRCSDDHESAVLPKFYIRVPANRSFGSQQRQSKALSADAVKRYGRAVNIASLCIYHRHHQARRTTRPLDDDHMPRKIRPWLVVFAVPEDSPPLVYAFPNSRSVHSLLW